LTPDAILHPSFLALRKKAPLQREKSQRGKKKKRGEYSPLCSLFYRAALDKGKKKKGKMSSVFSPLFERVAVQQGRGKKEGGELRLSFSWKASDGRKEGGGGDPSAALNLHNLGEKQSRYTKGSEEEGGRGTQADLVRTVTFPVFIPQGERGAR